MIDALLNIHTGKLSIIKKYGKSFESTSDDNVESIKFKRQVVVMPIALWFVLRTHNHEAYVGLETYYTGNVAINNKRLSFDFKWTHTDHRWC